MPEINIKIKSQDKNGWIFKVEIAELFNESQDKDGSKTIHIIEVDKSYYNKLTNGKIKSKDLVKKSFEFLLAREPKESILKEFNLKEIFRYFPEYEKDIIL